jgi:hypothetical protein
MDIKYNTLFKNIKQSGEHCEHLCLVGIRHLKDCPEGHAHYTTVFDSCVVDADDNVEVFNFCPRCGQEIKIELEEHKTFIKIKRGE